MRLEIKRFFKVMWIWGNKVSSFWSGVLNWTLWMTLTLNLILLAFPWLVIYGFSNCSFCWHGAVQNWKSFFCFWANQDSPYLFVFTDFGQVNYFSESRQDLSQPKTISTLSVSKKIQEFKNHARIWNKSCSMIQSAEIINRLGSPVNK